jgi:hypothetical protein
MKLPIYDAQQRNQLEGFKTFNYLVPTHETSCCQAGRRTGQV